MKTPVLLRFFGMGSILSAAATGLQAQDTIIVPCDGDTVIGTYCYANNDQHSWYWQSACGYPVTVHFISGTIEGNASDQMRIYDGPDAVSALIFSNPGDDLDLADLSFVGGSGELYMEMTSDAVNCCATDEFGFRDAGWQWHWAVTSGGTAGISAERAVPFAMYPNPAKDEVLLQLPAGTDGGGEVRIMDVAGRLVHRESLSSMASGRIRIGLGSLGNGLYQVVLATPDGLQARRLQVVR